MNFSALSIKNPIPAIILFTLLTLAGLLAFKATPVQDFPDIDLPIVIISATLEGAAPAQLETEVARKLENSVATLEGIKHIITTVRDGEVTIQVHFVLEKVTSDAVNEVRNAVDKIRTDLPASLRDPSVSRVSNAGRAVLVFSVSSDKLDEQELSWFIDNTVTKKLLTIPGLGAVKRLGGVTREALIELDPAKMDALKISALEVSHRLKMVQQEISGGRGDVSGAEQSVRTIATVKSVDELASIELPLQQGNQDNRKIRLDQIATIIDTFSERRSIALENGNSVVAMEILRTRGASEIEVAAKARELVANLKTEYPNVLFNPVIDNSIPVKENFEGSISMLYEGAILAVLVLWFFLRDWRSTFVAAIALPLSVIPAFFGMKLFDFTLNTVTLLSLALGVGILVDDAIVEIENISRHLRMGKTPMQAATEAADEIGLAVIATTFALIAVFLPTAFMNGVAGKFFKQFGWTAVLAIITSLVVARMLTPLMAAYLLKPPKDDISNDGWVMQR
ncbi:MAG: efflux RND transporter permease subunit, partial [Methylococcales bacterium]